jgi:hypothetical protein
MKSLGSNFTDGVNFAIPVVTMFSLDQFIFFKERFLDLIKRGSLITSTTRNYLLCDVIILSQIKQNPSQISICDDLNFRGGMSVIN